MSVRVMSHVWEHSDARLGARLVLLAIADFANDSGMAWPSVETLAAKSRLSSRQVQRILRQLVNDGDLTLHENAGPHGCHLYQIALAGDKSSGRQIVRGDKSSVKGVTNRTGGVTNPTKNVSKMSPEPSIEPSLEPSGEPLDRRKRSTPRRGTQVPDTFPIDERWVQWADDNGFSVDQLRAQVPQFLDFYRAKGETRKDWDASFRTWMRNARDWGHLNGSKITPFQSNGNRKQGGWSADDFAAYALELERQGQ
jgi:hypothetical protein